MKASHNLSAYAIMQTFTELACNKPLNPKVHLDKHSNESESPHFLTKEPISLKPSSPPTQL